jgi:hypothetical protein
VPLVIGQRLIGVLAVWRNTAFKSDEWNRLTDLAIQVAPAVETIITFAEMAGHLRRLGTLNDFALTVSSGRNLDQIARRMFALLAPLHQLIVFYLLFRQCLLTEYRTVMATYFYRPEAADHRITPLLSNSQRCGWASG